MAPVVDEAIFPSLTAAELDFLRPLAERVAFADGDAVFRVGDAELDLYVIEDGAIEIRNPADGESVIVTHRANEFAGDIDLLTGRPIIVNGVARGPTRLLRVPHAKLRALLNRVPSFGEKLINAITRRRDALSRFGALGLKIVGPGYCKDTTVVREFLYKNFVPFTWTDTELPAGAAVLEQYGPPFRTPIIDCRNGTVLRNPSLHELAKCAGVWRPCPNATVDLAVVGAGPAGISAALYAASEGLSTLILDRLGPGGQAGGSSKIENFIGFPAGLSGAELATRGVLQLLKFGGRMVAPVVVDRVETAAGPGGQHFLHLDCGAKIGARVVLAATGVRWRKLPARNAVRYEGAGVHYVCTAVEAVLYDRCDVAVVGGGNSAGQAAMHLAEHCRERRVHLVVRGRLGPSMSDYLVSRIRGTANITVHEETEIVELDGGPQMKTMTLAHKSGRTEQRPCVGVFVFIGAEPAVEWLPAEVARDKLGYVLTGSDVVRAGRWPLADRDPCPLETSVPGLLAAGDIRSGSTKRVGFAVGDGSLAVTCTHKLLSQVQESARG